MKKEVLIAVLENKRLDVELKKFALEDAKAEIKRKESEAELNAVKRDVAYRDPQVFTTNIKRQAEMIHYRDGRIKWFEGQIVLKDDRIRYLETEAKKLDYPAVKFVLYLKDKLFTIRTKPQNN